MTKIYLTVVLFVCTFFSAFSQNENLLKIDVNGPALADVAFSYKGQLQVSRIKLDSSWQLMLNDTGHHALKINLVNMVGRGDSISLHSLNFTLSVPAGKIEGFQLAQMFKLKVYLNDSLVIFRECAYGTAPGGAVVPVAAPGAPVTAPAGTGQPPTVAANVGAMINDALKLAGNPTLGDAQEILAYYAHVKNTATAVGAAYADNKHLQIFVALKIDGADVHGSDNFVGSLLNNVGGLDVTNLALGATDFIIKRGKEELNIAFFKKFQDLISKPELRDLQTVFPATWRTLYLVGDDIYNYNRYLQTLQNAFKNDIAQLSANLPSIIDNHPLFFAAHPELEASLRSGLYFANSLRDGVHPGEIIDQYDASLLDKFNCTFTPAGVVTNPNYRTSVELLQLLSFSLRNQTSETNTAYWVAPKMLQQLVANPIAAKYFLGLLYQYGKTRFTQLNFKTGSDTINVLKSINDLADHEADIKAWFNYLSTLVIKTQSLNALVKTYERQSSDSMKIEQLYTYFQASVDLLKYATRITQLPGLKDPGLEQKFSVYFETADAAASLIVNANRAQYTAAVSDAVRIYDLVRNKYHEATVKLLKDALAVKDITDAEKAVLEAQLKKEMAVSGLTKNFFRYGTFMATVADADSPKEVSDAIEAFALPAGSARIKRESPFNVSLNAYAGLYAGYERISGLKADRNAKINSYGVTIPIGVAISTGCSHWSYSAFLSLVDLGAVAAFRVKNDSVNEVPSIQLKDVFSPGLFFSLGLPKSPISLNLGAQVGPNLRKVTTTENDYSGNTYLRFSLSVLVDIPLLNFYTKTKED
ncbi:hypothetical protein [Chitinophaga sp. GbtcB8]|uniref:hypothetical protein n=1 Tax=Chitinophaga sp. GbtcB8 TaxID=2824753 RepID=UPI001C2F96D6|nr:hypothetical protein [Chitinophaga sp. GbtcB8]